MFYKLTSQPEIMSSDQKKVIQINPEFLKMPYKTSRTRKKKEDGENKPKPIKIRPTVADNKSIKRKALNYIRRQQEDRYKRLMKGEEEGENHRVATVDPKHTYANEFKNEFDNSLAFFEKISDQVSQKVKVNAGATLKQYPNPTPNSALFNSAVLNDTLGYGGPLNLDDTSNEPPIHLGGFDSNNHFISGGGGERTTAISSYPASSNYPKYGCLKNGRLPTYRTWKNMNSVATPTNHVAPPISGAVSPRALNQPQNTQIIDGASQPTNQINLSPAQQRAELKQFLNKRKEEKERVERVKKQHNILKPIKKQKRITRRTFRVGKSKHYPQVGVLVSNKTIRDQVLAKKQQIRETSIDEIRKYLVKKGLIRVGSTCPNDVLRKMYESSMLMCGEIQNHNPDNLLYNYLHNAV